MLPVPPPPPLQPQPPSRPPTASELLEGLNAELSMEESRMARARHHVSVAGDLLGSRSSSSRPSAASQQAALALTSSRPSAAAQEADDSDDVVFMVPLAKPMPKSKKVIPLPSVG